MSSFEKVHVYRINVTPWIFGGTESKYTCGIIESRYWDHVKRTLDRTLASLERYSAFSRIFMIITHT